MQAGSREADASRVPRGLAVCLVLGLLLIVVSRIPQLASPNLNLDGDEAVVALMSKRVSEGQPLTVFFQGQCYGLSSIEVAAGASFFHRFGMSAVTLKAAMLVLWSLGWIFFVLAIRRLSNLRIACIAGCVLISCPAWGAWSMMARGGYVTAFLFANLALWLFASSYKAETPRLGLHALLGACSGVLLLAQPITLLALGPFILVLMRRHRKIAPTLMLAAGVAAVLAVVLGATAGEQLCYWSPDLFENADVFQGLMLLPERLWYFLTGIYYYSEHEIARGGFTILSASSWWALIVLLFLRTIQVSIRRQHHEVALACVASVALVMAFSLATGSFGYRYFLSLPVLLLVYFSVEAGRLGVLARRGKIASFTLIGVIVASGMISLNEAARYSRGVELTVGSTDIEAEGELVRDLLANEVTKVYCLHATFQWNIMWRSRESITARWLSPVDRYPEHPRTVDRALLSGEDVALVGTESQRKKMEAFMAQRWPDVPIHAVAGRYFWILNPSPRLLTSLGFRLNDPASLER